MTRPFALNGLTLDTGALVAIELGDPRMRALLSQAVEQGIAVHVPSGVVAQAWRGGACQARVARLLNSTTVQVPALDALNARAVGYLSGTSGHDDVVDVQVMFDARLHGHRVVTSDPADLGGIDPSIVLIAI